MKQILIAAALFAAAQPLAAQAPIAGTYAVEYPVRMMVNGEPSPNETMAKVKLVLEQKGDSVFGTWQMVDGTRAIPAQKLAGTAKDGTARLYGTSEARMRNPDGEQVMTMTMEYVMTVDAETISGAIHVHPPEGITVSGEPRRFSGKREKA
jgi:hypothetical protein